MLIVFTRYQRFLPASRQWHPAPLGPAYRQAASVRIWRWTDAAWLALCAASAGQHHTQLAASRHACKLCCKDKAAAWPAGQRASMTLQKTPHASWFAAVGCAVTRVEASHAARRSASCIGKQRKSLLGTRQWRPSKSTPAHHASHDLQRPGRPRGWGSRCLAQQNCRFLPGQLSAGRGSGVHALIRSPSARRATRAPAVRRLCTGTSCSLMRTTWPPWEPSSTSPCRAESTCTQGRGDQLRTKTSGSLVRTAWPPRGPTSDGLVLSGRCA